MPHFKAGKDLKERVFKGVVIKVKLRQKEFKVTCRTYKKTFGLGRNLLPHVLKITK